MVEPTAPLTEKQEEEQRVREQVRQAIEARKAEALRKYRETEIAKVEAEFEKELQAKKAEAEAAFRRQEKEVEARFKGRQTFIRKIETKAEARRRGRLLRPTERKAVEAEVKAELTAYEREKQAIRDVFEQGLTEWVVEQREAFKVQKKAVVQEYETQLEKWGTEATAKMEPKIGEYMALWKPKAVATKLIEAAPKIVPDLPRMEIKLFDIPVQGGVLRVGFDIGKFGEELMYGTIQAGAGLVASFESVAYGIGALAGVRDIPAPPATALGALMTEGITELGTATGLWTTRFERGELGRMDPRYALGSVLGDVVLIWAGGKVIAQAARPVKYVAAKIAAPIAKPFKAVVTRITTPITKPITTAWRGSRIDKFLYERSKWYVRATGAMPKAYVTMPKARLPSMLPVKGEVVPTIGIKDIRLAQLAKETFALTEAVGVTGYVPYPVAGVAPAAAPKIGVTILKPWVKAAVPTVTVKAGEFVGISEAAKKSIADFMKATRAEVAAPQLVQVPKKLVIGLPALARLPEVGVRAAIAYPSLGEILGMGAVIGVRAAPRVREKVAEVPALAPAVAQVARVKIAQVPVQKAVQVQIQTQLQQSVLGVPSPPPTLPLVPPPPKKKEKEEIRRIRRKRKREELAFRAGILEYDIREMTKLARHILKT